MVAFSVPVESDADSVESEASDQWKAANFLCTASIQLIPVVNPGPVASSVLVVMTVLFTQLTRLLSCVDGHLRPDQ